MRPDFGKVLTERPRAYRPMGPKSTYGKVRASVSPTYLFDEDDGWDCMDPVKVGVRNTRGSKYGRKSFSDLLGPLVRLLRKNVGRPWDKVQGEISKHLPRRGNTVQAHIWQHLEHLVKIQCVRDGHQILDSKGLVIADLKRNVKIRRGFSSGNFYVDQTGLLRELPTVASHV